jgi:hypothetical protein
VPIPSWHTQSELVTILAHARNATRANVPTGPSPKTGYRCRMLWRLVCYPTDEGLIEPTADIEADRQNDERHDADEGSASSEIVQ